MFDENAQDSKMELFDQIWSFQQNYAQYKLYEYDIVESNPSAFKFTDNLHCYHHLGYARHIKQLQKNMILT